MGEEGRLTQKYYKAKELMSQYREDVVYLHNDTPTMPDIPAAIAHGTGTDTDCWSLSLQHYVSWTGLLQVTLCLTMWH